MDAHSTQIGSFGLERLGTHRRQERGEHLPVLAPGRASPELVPEEGEGGVLVATPALPVLAVDDPRFDALMFVKSRE